MAIINMTPISTKDFYEEVFESNAKCDDYNQAECVLESIRRQHSKKHGWVEIEHEIAQNADGKFIVKRHHRKYKDLKKIPKKYQTK